MTRERIDALDADKTRLGAELERLRVELARLSPENARLREALANAEANNIVSTVLIGVGGGVISYATLTGRVSQRVADVGAGALLAGVLLLMLANFRRWIAG